MNLFESPNHIYTSSKKNLKNNTLSSDKIIEDYTFLSLVNSKEVNDTKNPKFEEFVKFVKKVAPNPNLLIAHEFIHLAIKDS